MGRAESRRVAAIRWSLQHWPFPRGRGVLLRFAAPLLLERPLTCQLEPGVLVQGDPDEHQFRYYLAYGLARDPSFSLARRIVNLGDTVIDVGANVGFWLMGVARRAGPGAVIHAFEAFPPNVERLRAHLELNGLTWVHCHSVAVGAMPGEANFIMPPDGNRGVGSLACGGEMSDIKVPVTTLDAFCREQGVSRVDMLKVDVEGAERLVFLGAQSLLSSRKPPIIMFEVGDTLARRFGTTSPEIKALLERSGYGIFRFDGVKLRCVPTAEEQPVSEDLFALRSSHLDERPWLQDLIE
jgi:FkbM family methyltransferase